MRTRPTVTVLVWSVCVSVSWSRVSVSCSKMDEPFDMPVNRPSPHLMLRRVIRRKYTVMMNAGDSSLEG